MEIPHLIINWADSNLWIAVFLIIFSSVLWNVICFQRSRWFSNKTPSLHETAEVILTYFFDVTEYLMELYKNWRFIVAVDSQPRWATLQQNAILWFGYSCIFIGACYLCRNSKAAGFSHAVFSRPHGPSSCLNENHRMKYLIYVGFSLVKASQVGLLMTGVIAASHEITVRYKCENIKSINTR